MLYLKKKLDYLLQGNNMKKYIVVPVLIGSLFYVEKCTGKTTIIDPDPCYQIVIRKIVKEHKEHDKIIEQLKQEINVFYKEREALLKYDALKKKE